MSDSYQARLSRNKYACLAVDTALKYKLDNTKMYQLSHFLSAIDKYVEDEEFLLQCAHNYGKVNAG